MTELPHASPNEDANLKDRPVDRPRVGRIAQRSEVVLSFTLKLLFATDVGQSSVEVAYFARQIGDVILFDGLVYFGFTDGDVEVKPDLRRGEPAGGVAMRVLYRKDRQLRRVEDALCPQADGVISRFVRGKGELALWQSSRRYDLLLRFDFLCSEVSYLVDNRDEATDLYSDLYPQSIVDDEFALIL